MKPVRQILDHWFVSGAIRSVSVALGIDSGIDNLLNKRLLDLDEDIYFEINQWEVKPAVERELEA